MTSGREDFLRRYATSPIHVARLERLLDVYGGADPDAFAAKFIEWDRGCATVDAARIVTEVICTCVDGSGRIARLSDDQLIEAIRWMDKGPAATDERAATLREMLRSV